MKHIHKHSSHNFYRPKQSTQEHPDRYSVSKKTRVSIETGAYITGWILCVLALVGFALLSFFDLKLTDLVGKCALKELAGVYCPGCGGTRATVFFLTGHWLRSLIYHPLVPYAGILGGWFMISQTIERLSSHRIKIGMKYHDNYLWVSLFLVVFHFLALNVFLFCFHIDLLTL